MNAAQLDVKAAQLPDDLGALLGRIARAVPAGVGKAHDEISGPAGRFMRDRRPATDLSAKQERTALTQFGTLGSGNHFVEVCLDAADRVWVVLHSGSRGIGNQLAQAHIASARRLAKLDQTPLEDPDLAWFTQGTAEFDAYITDLLWAQDYARARPTLFDRPAANGGVPSLVTETRPRRLGFTGRALLRSAAKDGLPSGEGRAGNRRPPFDSAPLVRHVP